MADGSVAAGRRPRQADIARAAGVSQATVSMVLNHRVGEHHQIGEDTRRRVWAAVEQLGYVANPAARTLAGGRNSVVGVYTFESVFPVDHRDFYHPFLIGIEEEAERQGFDLLLFSSASGPDRNRAIFRDGVNRLRIADGCVLLGRGGDRHELARLANDAFPIVSVGRRELPDAQMSYVGADYAAGTAEIVRHLAAHGHRRVALLSWDDDLEPTTDRVQGFRSGCADADVAFDPRLCRPVADADVTTTLLEELVQAGATAVIAQDEVIAVRLESAAALLGLTVPGDLSVAVLGDPPRGEPSGRDWTGFEIPRRRMGATALHTLVQRLDGHDGQPHQSLLPCTFQAGSTVAPAAS